MAVGMTRVAKESGDHQQARIANLERAVHDPQYRLHILVNGNPDLEEVIDVALWHVEAAFRAALAGTGLSMCIKSLHPQKANHQKCNME